MPLRNKIRPHVPDARQSLQSRSTTANIPALPASARASAPASARASALSSWGGARLALTAFFAVDGLLFAAWVVRIPDVRNQVSASHSALGLALLCVSAGAVATMSAVSRLCLRYGSRPVTVASLTLLALAVPLPAHTHSVAALGGVLLLFGAGYGAANVAMNSAAVEIVRDLGRPVMPSFHAGYSLGGLLGAGAGGLLAGTLTAAQWLAAAGLLGLAVTAAAGVALLRSPAARPVGTASTAPSSGSTAPSGTAAGAGRVLVLLLGLTALCTAYGEGSIADWTTVHLTDDVHAGAQVAAAGYVAYALAMTTGRLCGTWLSVRLGQHRVMLLGGLTAAAGMLLAALAPLVPLALAGFVLVGLGLANIFPLAIAQAGAAGGPQGVALASTLGYGGMLIGPPVIGFLADATSLPLALTTVAATAAVAAVLPLAVRRH
ncbi:MFS transporter [Kitasatospora misakiensis]|uniref:MFS transporter n=1 Tax=Kitasatospora misakiensis TaxID=67330 RepID=A0ABW0X7T4_9ACTN